MTVYTTSDLVDIGTHRHLVIQLDPQIPHTVSGVNDSITNSQ